MGLFGVYTYVRHGVHNPYCKSSKMSIRDEIEELLQTSAKLRKQSERLRGEQKELKKKIRALKSDNQGLQKKDPRF